MSGIFVSYRRGPGASEAAGRLYDRLAAEYGESNVFMDVDTVRPGMDFVEAIGQAIESCDAVLAIIDPNWAVDSNDRKRIAETNDYVRLEIASALDRGVTVIPVLVLGAEMPTPDQLPPDVRPIGNRQAVTVSHERFTTDVLPLERELGDLMAGPKSKPTPAGPAPVSPEGKQTLPGRPSRRTWAWVALLVVLAIAVIVIANLSDPTSPSGEVEIVEFRHEGDRVVVIVMNHGQTPKSGNVTCDSTSGSLYFPFDNIPSGDPVQLEHSLPSEEQLGDCRFE